MPVHSSRKDSIVSASPSERSKKQHKKRADATSPHTPGRTRVRKPKGTVSSPKDSKKVNKKPELAPAPQEPAKQTNPAPPQTAPSKLKDRSLKSGQDWQGYDPRSDHRRPQTRAGEGPDIRLLAAQYKSPTPPQFEGWEYPGTPPLTLEDFMGPQWSPFVKGYPPLPLDTSPPSEFQLWKAEHETMEKERETAWVAQSETEGQGQKKTEIASPLQYRYNDAEQMSWNQTQRASDDPSKSVEPVVHLPVTSELVEKFGSRSRHPKELQNSGTHFDG